MSTKSASYRFGNTNGSKHKGEATEHIGYAWCKGFNRGGLLKHYLEHGKEFGNISIEEYASQAVHFANTIDRKNYKSVVDYKHTTYKYDSRNDLFVEVSKDGYAISYHHIKDKFWYYSKKKGNKVWIKI
jgi:hypothetical protein